MLKTLCVVLVSIVLFSSLSNADSVCKNILESGVAPLNLKPWANQASGEFANLLPAAMYKSLPESFVVKGVDQEDLEYLTYLTNKITRRKDLTEANVFDGLVRAKRQYERKIEKNGIFIGQRVNETTRRMRQRRDEFELFIKSRDASGAAAVYRSLWESFYVSKSALLQYTRSAKTEAEQRRFVSDMRETLLGLAEASHLRKVKKRLHSLYGENTFSAVRNFVTFSRTPDPKEILEILDTIYALSRSEFMYANERVKGILEDSESSNSIRETVESFVEYMNPDMFAARFRVDLLSRAELESYETAEELFRLRPQTLVLWLKHVSEVESWRSVALLFRAGVQEVGMRLTDFILPNKLKDPVRRLFMLNYNTYVLDRHIEKISSVVAASVEDQVEIFSKMVEKGDSNSQNQFLETFARLSGDAVIWNRIKKHYESLSKEENTSRIMVERMQEAEKYISTYGYLSRTYKLSNLDFMIAVGIRSTAITTVYFNAEVIRGYSNVFLDLFR